jgi:hypothetical protein
MRCSECGSLSSSCACDRPATQPHSGNPQRPAWLDQLTVPTTLVAETKAANGSLTPLIPQAAAIEAPLFGAPALRGQVLHLTQRETTKGWSLWDRELIVLNRAILFASISLGVGWLMGRIDLVLPTGLVCTFACLAAGLAILALGPLSLHWNPWRKRESGCPERLIRTRLEDGRQRDISLLGPLVHGHLATGDDLSFWGWASWGHWKCRLAYNHTTTSWIVVAPRVYWVPLALALVFAAGGVYVLTETFSIVP